MLQIPSKPSTCGSQHMQSPIPTQEVTDQYFPTWFKFVCVSIIHLDEVFILSRRSVHPVRTSDSYGSDARATKKEIADSTSTVRTTAYHGPDSRITDMEIAC
jgi:hypothetical protein